MDDLDRLWQRWLEPHPSNTMAYDGVHRRAKKVFDALVVGHQDLVRTIAKSARVPNHVDGDDLEQAGQIGLMRAVKTWEPDKGPFEEWAIWRIKNAMQNELRSNDKAVGRDYRRALRDLHLAEERLIGRLHRPPTDRELAGALKVTEEKIGDLRVVELMASGPGTDEFEVANYEDPAEIAIVNGHRAELIEALEALDGRESLVLRLYYLERLKFGEIGALIGLKAPMVSRLHTRGMARLRENLGR